MSANRERWKMLRKSNKNFVAHFPFLLNITRQLQTVYMQCFILFILLFFVHRHRHYRQMVPLRLSFRWKKWNASYNMTFDTNAFNVPCILHFISYSLVSWYCCFASLLFSRITCFFRYIRRTPCIGWNVTFIHIIDNK